jgi:uncharacterized DUF497 family protein
MAKLTNAALCRFQNVIFRGNANPISRLFHQ